MRAFLDQETYNLKVYLMGDGSGITISTPPGINCGTDCSESYSEGTTVTLTPIPDEGSSFTGWSGACSGTGTCQVSMTSNKAVTAKFTHVYSTEPFYFTIPLTWVGSIYAGTISNVTIAPNQAQQFFRVELPPACTEGIQFAIVGANQANENMLISNRDFGTVEDALLIYKFLLEYPIIIQFEEVIINGATYWFDFKGSYEYELISILNPADTTYYIQIVNESNIMGIYRIEAYCW